LTFLLPVRFFVASCDVSGKRDRPERTSASAGMVRLAVVRWGAFGQSSRSMVRNVLKRWLFAAPTDSGDALVLAQIDGQNRTVSAVAFVVVVIVQASRGASNGMA
jgi:hypothetical protein